MTVLLFARARDLVGAAAVRLDPPCPATVGAVRRTLAARYPQLAALLERSALAVGDEFADDATPLAPDAEVALLPPVSGG